MRLTVRQIVVGAIPSLVAILGFFWFRRKKKDPAICWKEEPVPVEEKVKSSQSAASQTSQRLKGDSKESVTTQKVVSAVAEEPVSVVKAEPLLLCKVAEPVQQEKTASNTVSDISVQGISSIESQILPVCVKTTEELSSVTPDSLRETSIKPAGVSSEQNDQSSIEESVHKESTQPISNGIEASIEQSIVAGSQVSIEPVITKSDDSQASESTPAAASQSASKVELASEPVGIVAEPVVSASKSANELKTAPSKDQTSAAQTQGEDLKAGGDENANTKSVLCKASKPEDYSLTNGHAMMNGEGDAPPAKTTKQQSSHQPTTEGDQTNGDGTDAQSEVSSDSGRGASGIETPTVSSPSELSDYVLYEFDFPSDFCGKLIGKAGKNINSIKSKTGAEIILKRKPFVRDYQNCCIEGTQAQVQAALEHIKRRFPQKQFGHISYRQTNIIDEAPMLAPEIMQVCLQQLSLPEGVSVDVVVSSVVAANHIFVQQPTHPTFSSLESLNYCMNVCYTQDNVVPQLPRPIDGGVICAAPVFQGWYRAQVMGFYPDTDECDIKYVDYGGYMRVGAATLRQIRSDFATLPFQAVECYLANVMPLEDEEEFGVEASVLLESLVQGQMLQAQITEHEADGVPYVQIYNLSNGQAVFVNRELVDSGTARWVETQG